MEIFTIGFAQTSAAEFFGKLTRAGVGRLLDVRLNNTGQLAGYTKRKDLPYFLREICGADYEHQPLLAPTKEMLDEHKGGNAYWPKYEEQFMELMAERQIELHLDRERFATTPTVLLCSERTADQCHRRLVLEYLVARWPEIVAMHL